MYDLLNAGVLGHTLPAAEEKLRALGLHWKLLKCYDPYSKCWAVRSKVANSSCLFNLNWLEALEEMRRLGENNFNFSPMLDDAKRICYAHLMRDGLKEIPGHWHLHYTTDPKPARLLESKDGCQQKWLNGLQTKMYLQGIMDSIGWDTLVRLTEEYPDHCIEFTVMMSRLYAFGPSNTIFWEVRCLTGEYEKDSFKPRKK